MPKPLERGQRYMPGLDGLRAVAVIVVIAYHLGFDWASGGLLGVGVFFTLSGYLITDILLSRRDSSGRLRLGDFWLRRARRLLPALFVLLVGVTIWVSLFDPSRLPELRGEVLAAVLYISNWWYIFRDVSYFANFGPPPALGHLWSLAVEEQFYLVWPLLLWLGLKVFPGKDGRHVAIAIFTVCLGVGSALLMSALYQPGYDPTRVYDGTDTRAFGLLFGAALAMVWPSHLLRYRPGKSALDRRNFMLRRAAFEITAVASLIAILAMVWQTDQYSGFLYRGGLVLLTLATVFVVGAVAHPECRIGGFLGWGPMRWIGVRSYGIYLWHYPVIVLTTPLLEPYPRLSAAFVQLLATVVIAALSWRFVEEPIRRGAIGEIFSTPRQRISRRNLATISASAAAILIASVGMAGAFGSEEQSDKGQRPEVGEAGGRIEITADEGAEPRPPTEQTSAAVRRSETNVSPEDDSSRAAESDNDRERSGAAQDEFANQDDAATQDGNAAGSDSPSTPGNTSCQSVVYIGDSTSEGMISPYYLPQPARRLDARFQSIGIESQILDITGARSVVETLPGDVSGYDAAESIAAQGFDGCWVIALGGNDAANVSIGSQVGMRERVDRIMSVADGDPVMWVTVKTLLDYGPYANANMGLWNETLRESCERYPKMRVFDWAASVQPAWFAEDGTHFTSRGYARRSALTAQALAGAYPQSEEAPEGCVVGGESG